MINFLLSMIQGYSKYLSNFYYTANILLLKMHNAIDREWLAFEDM